MRALIFCAQQHPRLLRKTDIAQACDVNENHLAQVIHVLGLRGFLQTKRGRMGGVTLARPAAQISVGEVFRALEAEVPFADCFESHGGTCPLRRQCGLKCLLARAVAAFYDTLDEVSLAEVVEGSCDPAAVVAGLEELVGIAHGPAAVAPGAGPGAPPLVFPSPRAAHSAAPGPAAAQRPLVDSLGAASAPGFSDSN